MPGDEGQAVSLLPVAPWLSTALLLVLLVALSVPAPTTRRSAVRTRGSALARPPVAVVALLLSAGVVLLARLGPASELENPAPALVVGLGWPLLLLLPALLGLLVRRGAAAGDDGADGDDAEDHAPRDVRPAVVAAVAVAGYLALAVRPTAPRTLAVAVAVYALVLVAVAVALGSPAVARAEALGLLARWASLGPRLVRWHPPRGAAAVLVVVLGGTWAERAQRTSAWTERLPGRPAQVLLVAVAVGVAAMAAVALTRWSDGRAAPVLLPLVVATVVASVLRRALISAQLVWDTAGPGRSGVLTDPLGAAGGQAAALAVVAVGGALAATVLARRVGGGSARLPGTGVVLAVTAVSGYVVLLP